MRIDRVQTGVAPGRPARAKTAGGFGEVLAGEVTGGEGEAGGVGEAAAPAALLPPALNSALDSVLEPAQVRDRSARRHGKAMLEALAGLQLAALGGDPSPVLEGLAELARTPPEAADPVLRLILHEINIRAAVELARPWGRAGGSPLA